MAHRARMHVRSASKPPNSACSEPERRYGGKTSLLQSGKSKGSTQRLLSNFCRTFNAGSKPLKGNAGRFAKNSAFRSTSLQIHALLSLSRPYEPLVSVLKLSYARSRPPVPAANSRGTPERHLRRPAAKAWLVAMTPQRLLVHPEAGDGRADTDPDQQTRQHPPQLNGGTNGRGLSRWP